MPVPEGTLVDVWTKLDVGSGMWPWVLRAHEFMFPAPVPARIMPPDGPAYLERELTREESEKTRYYLEVRGTVQTERKQNKIIFIRAIRALFEIVDGRLYDPELSDWQEHQVKVFITDLEHFSTYRNATQSEAAAWATRVSIQYPSGAPS